MLKMGQQHSKLQNAGTLGTQVSLNQLLSQCNLGFIRIGDRQIEDLSTCKAGAITVTM